MELKPIPAPNYTQSPNIVYDEWLPHLTFVELKVLMVIIRKTFGWHKIRDRISISQLVKSTGSTDTNVVKAANSLQKRGLILKHVEGENGVQKTSYELVVMENSNNLDPSCRGGGTPPATGGTKETKTKEKKGEKEGSRSDPKKDSPAAQTTRRKSAPTATSSQIRFDKNTRKFENISEQDIKSWKFKFPALHIEREIDLCAEWAMSSPRKNYRKSIVTWLKNVQNNNTTPYVPHENPKVEVDEATVMKNRSLAEEWEILVSPEVRVHYMIYPHPGKVEFIMPSNQGYDVSYLMPTKDFLKKCQPALGKMRIQYAEYGRFS